MVALAKFGSIWEGQNRVIHFLIFRTFDLRFKVVTTPSGKPKLKDEQEYTYFFHTRLKGGHVAENKKGRPFRKEKHKNQIGWD